MIKQIAAVGVSSNQKTAQITLFEYTTKIDKKNIVNNWCASRCGSENEHTSEKNNAEQIEGKTKNLEEKIYFSWKNCSVVKIKKIEIIFVCFLTLCFRVFVCVYVRLARFYMCIYVNVRVRAAVLPREKKQQKIK